MTTTLVETASVLVKTGSVLVKTGSVLVKTGSVLVQAGSVLVKTGSMLVKTGSKVAKAGSVLAEAGREGQDERRAVLVRCGARRGVRDSSWTLAVAGVSAVEARTAVRGRALEKMCYIRHDSVVNDNVSQSLCTKSNSLNLFIFSSLNWNA